MEGKRKRYTVGGLNAGMAADILYNHKLRASAYALTLNKFHAIHDSYPCPTSHIVSNVL